MRDEEGVCGLDEGGVDKAKFRGNRLLAEFSMMITSPACSHCEQRTGASDWIGRLVRKSDKISVQIRLFGSLT